jgi:hypothetical protein
MGACLLVQGCVLCTGCHSNPKKQRACACRDARFAQDAIFTLLEYQDSMCAYGTPVDVLCDKVAGGT